MVECGKLEEKLLPSKELLEAVKEESAGFVSDASGQTIVLNLLKDVTLESFRGEITPGFFPQDKGRSMSQLWDILKIIKGKSDSSDADIRSILGPFINMWRLSTMNEWAGLHLLLTRIVLRCVNPLCLQIYSSTLFDLLSRAPSSLVEIETIVRDDPECIISYMDSKKVVEERFWDAMKKLEVTKSKKVFTYDHVGVPVVITTGWDEQHCSIMIPNLHPGDLAYDSRLALYKFEVMTLVAIKMDIMEKRLGHALDAELQAWLKVDHCGYLDGEIKKLKTCVKKIGLDAALGQTKATLRMIQRAVVTLDRVHVVNGVLKKMICNHCGGGHSGTYYT
jgi:hypothetical protein